MPKKPLKKNDENRVTIHIWKMNSSTAFFKKQEIGHVSLQTYTGGPEDKGIYASLYPATASAVTDREGVEPRFNSYGDDHGNGRLPEHSIDLYSLDVAAINSFYWRLKNSGLKYAPIASTFLADAKTHTCATFVRALLLKGNIKSLLFEIRWSILFDFIFEIFIGTAGIEIMADFPLALGALPRNRKALLGATLGMGLEWFGPKHSPHPISGISIDYSTKKGILTGIIGFSIFALGLVTMTTVLNYMRIGEYLDNSSNFNYLLGFVVGTMTALITTAGNEIAILLGKAVITPNDIMKLAKHAEKMQE